MVREGTMAVAMVVARMVWGCHRPRNGKAVSRARPASPLQVQRRKACDVQTITAATKRSNDLTSALVARHI